MAKQTLPGIKTGGGALPKLITGLVALAVLTLVVKHPVESAHWFSGAATSLKDVVEALATFLQTVHQ